MSVAFRNLPALTKTHLANLIRNQFYRQSASHMSYNCRPLMDGGIVDTSATPAQVTKYGYRAGLAAAAALRGAGPDPGRERVAVWRQGSRLSWWQFVHAPGNAYRANVIAFRPCVRCKGTGSGVCPTCGGQGRTRTAATAANPIASIALCPQCRGAGFADCTACDPKLAVNGHTVSLNTDDW